MTLTPEAFLFCAVAVAGIAIIARAPFNRRNRFILTASLSVGFGAILVPNWFSNVFTYKGDNRALTGFLNAIVLVMETGFAVTALLAMLLNLSIASEIEVDAKLLRGRATAEEIRYSMNRGPNDKEVIETARSEPESKME